MICSASNRCWDSRRLVDKYFSLSCVRCPFNRNDAKRCKSGLPTDLRLKIGTRQNTRCSRYSRLKDGGHNNPQGDSVPKISLRMISQQRNHKPMGPTTATMAWHVKRPAGLSTYEIGYSRINNYITAQRPRNLPPIWDQARTGKRKAKVNDHSQKKEQEIQSSDGFRTRLTGTGHYPNEENERKDSLPPLKTTGIRSERRGSQIIATNENEAMFFRKLRGIYSNSMDRTLRAQRIQRSINSLQSRTLHCEIAQSLKDHKKKVETEKRNRSKLKRIREKYTQDKKRRNSRSYMSLNALEFPQVSRHAYGLPKEGHEFGNSDATESGQKQLYGILQKAMKRAALVSRFVNLHIQDRVPSPEIIVRRKKSKASRGSQDDRKDSSTDTAINMDVVLGEIDAMSTVLSESAEDDEEVDKDD